MNINTINDLINVRNYLSMMVNGFSTIPKAQIKTVTEKLREIDALLIKELVDFDVENIMPKTAKFRCSDEDFEKASKMVLDVHGSMLNNVGAGSVPASSDETAVVTTKDLVAAVPNDTTEVNDTLPSAPVKTSPKPAKKKGGFARATEE